MFIESNKEKISFDKLQKQVQPCSELRIEQIIKYFEYTFDDLTNRRIIQNSQEKVICTMTFCDYLDLPSVISERIFQIFKEEENLISTNTSEFMNKFQFIQGMINLYFGSYEVIIKIVFKIFNLSNYQNSVHFEDVMLIFKLLNTCNSDKNNFPLIKEMVSEFFKDNDIMFFNYYKEEIENFNSTIFLHFLIILYSNQPFNKSSIEFLNNSFNDYKYENENSTDEIELKNKKREYKNFIKIPNEKLMNLFPKIFKKFMKNKIDRNNFPIFVDITKTILIFKEQKIANNISHYEEFFYTFRNLKINLSILNSDPKKILRGIKMIIKDKEIFTFDLSNSRIKNLIPLSGYYITKCEEIKINNENLFYFALVNKFGNTVANMNNIFLNKSKEIIESCVRHLRNLMKIENFEDQYEIIKENDSNYKICNVIFPSSQYKLGIDKNIKEKVLIKIIDKKSLNRKEIELIKNELEIMKILKCDTHPNLIKVKNIFEDKLKIYIVMEYTSEMQTLDKFYQKNNINIDESIVKIIAQQIASTLSFFNGYGIIHRDLKMENILIQNIDIKEYIIYDKNSISIKLVNFSLSKIISKFSKTKESYGTLLYAAPEILFNKFYDNKVDVWSFGVILYFLLFGEYPFDGIETQEIINKILTKNIDFNIMLFVNHQAKVLLIKCLNKNNKERININKIIFSDWMLS